MGGVLIEGVETSLDANLQLEAEKEEEDDRDSVSVILRDDLRQPLESGRDLALSRHEERTAASTEHARNVTGSFQNQNQSSGLGMRAIGERMEIDKPVESVEEDFERNAQRSKRENSRNITTQDKITVSQDKSQDEASTSSLNITQDRTSVFNMTQDDERPTVGFNENTDGSDKRKALAENEQHYSADADVPMEVELNRDAQRGMDSNGAMLDAGAGPSNESSTSTFQSLDHVVHSSDTTGTVDKTDEHVPPIQDEAEMKRVLPSDYQKEWFSLLPRQSCEANQIIYTSNQSILSSNQQQVGVTDSTQLQTEQQNTLAAPSASPTQQYVYVTQDGQVLGSAPPQAVQQVMGSAGGSNVGYALVGNTLVPVATGQSPYVSINSGTQQQNVQYLIAQQDQQGQVQYIAVGGGAAATGQDGSGSGTGMLSASQQPYLAIADANGQQQIVQVVTRDDGGQMLVQVTPEQLQGQAGQIVIAPSQQSGQVVVGATATGGQTGQVVLASPRPPANQVIVGQGQSGQVVLTAPPQSNQVLIGQGQTGQMVLAAPQANQVMIGQGQSGQVVVVAPQQANQVIIGQGQSGPVVLAAPQSNQVVIGPQGESSVAVLNDQNQDIIRGGQLVQIAEQDQYGILSSDGTKLMLAESKEAAIAALQAASIASASNVVAVQQTPSHHSTSPAKPSHASPLLTTPMAPPTQSPQPTHSPYPNIKKEPLSPKGGGLADTSLSVATSFHSHASVSPLSGKATPTTVGQSTAAMETTDSSRQPTEQEVSVINGC